MVDIAWLAETGPCKKIKAGTRIPCPGGTASERAMYILLSGRVDVFKASAAGGTQSAGSLLPGDVFGGREFFTDADDCVYTAGIDSAVYVINEESFNELAWSRPEVLFEVVKGAYMPLRKLSASQKTTSVLTMEEKSKALTAAKAKGKPQAGALFQDGGGEALPTGGAKVPEFVVGDIFPEGHRFYPGVVKPEYSKLVFAKDYDCPFCKKQFSDYKIFRSKLYEAAPMRYDLRRYYTDFQTEWYDILTCKNCYFSTFYNYFNEPKPLKKELIEHTLASARASIPLDFDGERDLDFVFTAHFLAMICADGYLSAGKQIRAKLWGNLSWLYEDVGNEEMEKFCAGKAAEAYETVYKETRLTPVQEQATCLSIAGMQYRAGVDRNLKRFLFTAKTVKMGDRTFAKVAEDFMYELKADGDE